MTPTDTLSQSTLTEFESDDESDRCQAIAVSTSEQCQRIALAGIPYCSEHYDLLDSGERRTESA